MPKHKAQLDLSDTTIKKPYNPTLFSLSTDILYYQIALYLTNRGLLAYVQTHKNALRSLIPELERRKVTVSTSGTNTLILCEDYFMDQVTALVRFLI